MKSRYQIRVFCDACEKDSTLETWGCYHCGEDMHDGNHKFYISTVYDSTPLIEGSLVEMKKGLVIIQELENIPEVSLQNITTAEVVETFNRIFPKRN